MRLAVLAFAAGAWWLQQQADLPGSGAAWLMAASGMTGVLAFAGRERLSAVVRSATLLASCAVFGFTWAAWRAEIRLAHELPTQWEGRDIELIGVVAGLPRHTERGARFEFDVEAVDTPHARVPPRIVLSWWGGQAQDGTRTVPALQPGERWRFTVRLKRPRGMANPHGFDYEGWLFEHGIRATGYVRPRATRARLADTVHRPAYWIERVRSRVRAQIHAALPGAEHAGVIVALAVGDQRSISEEEWLTFTRTGVNHLMSISGLHVTMVSGLVFLLVYGLWRRVPILTLRLPALKCASGAALAAAVGYALLAGFSVPAQRTVYMLAVVAAALWLGVLGSASRVLSVALLAVVACDPWAVLAPGFWLSFGAVAIILFVTTGRIGCRHWLANWVRVQGAVTLAIVPVLLALFQQFSLVSPLANALAIPAVSLVVVPLTLVGVALPVDAVLWVAHGVMTLCITCLEWLSLLPQAVWQQAAPPGWAAAAGLVAVLWLLAPRGTPARWLGVIGLLPLFTVAHPPPEPGAAEIVVLDVGHGLSVVVRTARHVLLYDAGPRFGPGADAGTRVVLPFLRASGVERLDGVVISHDDDDHWGGAGSVLDQVSTGWIRTSLPDLDPLVVQAGFGMRCEAEQSWEWDGVRFDFLHPAAGDASHGGPDNDRSCVLKIEARGGRALLPGDIERRAEGALAQRARAGLRAEVLVAPHQGSRTSSSDAFVRAVDPRIVVFPVGYRNRFGHPHVDVVDRYRLHGARLYRTDRDGAVRIGIAGDGTISVTPWRAVYRRYWHTDISGDPVPPPVFRTQVRGTISGPGGSESR